MIRDFFLNTVPLYKKIKTTKFFWWTYFWRDSSLCPDILHYDTMILQAACTREILLAMRDSNSLSLNTRSGWCATLVSTHNFSFHSRQKMRVLKSCLLKRRKKNTWPLDCCAFCVFPVFLTRHFSKVSRLFLLGLLFLFQLTVLWKFYRLHCSN